MTFSNAPATPPVTDIGDGALTTDSSGRSTDIVRYIPEFNGISGKNVFVAETIPENATP